jgi:PAS domain S-box-containing protein
MLSEAQFHGFLEENPDAVIIIDQNGQINFASHRVETMFGHLPHELVGKPVSILIPEKHRDLHAVHMDRFMKNPTPRMMGVGLELRAIRKDGSEFPTEISLSPHRIPDGLVVVAAIRDIEATKRVQRLLLQELHHRVKNTLATVIAITSQSLQNAKNLEAGRLAVESRLMALGRAHDLLLQTNSTGAKLTDVIRDAVEPFDSSDVQRFVIQDTHIDIGPGAVLPLTMSLNELCTNAVKYGALSNSTGRIEIKSQVDEKAQRFKLKWTERGGPAVQEPTRRSFGTRLINRLAEQLQGDVRLRYEPAGMVYELDIPLAVLRAPAIDK